MKDFWSIQPKRPPKGFRAWLARKLIRVARWLAPTDDDVLAHACEEAMKQQILYGHAGFRVLGPEDFAAPSEE